MRDPTRERAVLSISIHFWLQTKIGYYGIALFKAPRSVEPVTVDEVGGYVDYLLYLSRGALHDLGSILWQTYTSSMHAKCGMTFRFTASQRPSD